MKVFDTVNTHNFYYEWEMELLRLRDNHLFRKMPNACGIPSRTIEIDGNQLLNFSGNNYLGLAGDPRLMAAMSHYSQLYGVGSTASRLIAGNTEIHRKLEEFIATWKNTEAAILFGSGYQANIGILSGLAQKGDLIISDALNHASIIDGCRLSRADVKIYPHLDVIALQDLLKKENHKKKYVVTESIFSMDGDKAPLDIIFNLCEKYGAVLMVDEAHSGGVMGPNGRGLSASFGIKPHIQMGTLGKAVGVSGAYVAGKRSLIDMLINKARSFIFTTAAPPAVAGTALAALEIVVSSEGDEKRANLTHNIESFRMIAEDLKIEIPKEISHIVPIMIGSSEKTMRVSEICKNEGVFAHGIRYPTVSEGSPRIRFTLMSQHTRKDIESALLVIKKALNQIS